MTSVDLEKVEEPQPPKKKPRIDESNQVAENAKSLDGEDRVFEMSTKAMDFPTAAYHSRPLPLEMNCEIFKCLKLPIQRKFIWVLGRRIYAMFGQKLLKKTKRLCNPKGNRFNQCKSKATVSEAGLEAKASATDISVNVFAEKGSPFLLKFAGKINSLAQSYIILKSGNYRPSIGHFLVASQMETFLTTI